MEISKSYGGEFEYGYHVKREYFDQQMEFENPELTVFDEMYNTFPNLTTTQIRTLLGTFLFTGEDVFKKIKVLSGGEKGRLQLCKIFKKGPNLLLLDEPTNHMDIVGKESLENMLKEYKGTLIFVSHDRYFVNKIADSLLIFEKNKVTYFDGTYEEFMRQKEEKSIEDETNNSEANWSTRNLNNAQVGNNTNNDKSLKKEENKKMDNPYFLNKEINRIKNKINKLEKEINEAEEEIEKTKQEMLNEDISTDYIKLKELEDKIQDINSNIENKMNEWEELNKKLEEKEDSN